MRLWRHDLADDDFSNDTRAQRVAAAAGAATCVRLAIQAERVRVWRCRQVGCLAWVVRPILIHKRLAQRCQMFWIRHRRVQRTDRPRPSTPVPRP